MKNLILSLLVAFSPASISFAQESIEFLIGDWDTFDNPFQNYGVRISDNKNGTLNLRYCGLWELRYTGDCKQQFAFEGTIQLNGQSIVVSEGSGSPNPTYNLTKEPDNVDHFIRKWGNQNVLYFRIK